MELVGLLEEDATGAMACGESCITTTTLLTEAAACIREMVEWRPIETAPGPDHAMFVVRAFEVRTFSGVIYTSDPVCVWRNIDGSFARWKQEFQPTHWLPLPPAPGAEA